MLSNNADDHEVFIFFVHHRFRLTQFLSETLLILSFLSVLTYVLGAQKNRLIKTVALSTHNICFG